MKLSTIETSETILTKTEYFHLGRKSKTGNTRPPFTRREYEVLKYTCMGFQSNEIARFLDISPRTVETYKANLFRMTNTNNTVKLMLHCIRNGYVSFRELIKNN